MIATDGSEAVKKAVDTAIEFAKMNNAKLYAVYVISYERISPAYPKDVGWDKALLDYFREEARGATSYVEKAGEAAGVNVEPVILDGSPANELVDFAEKNNIDLIVMGTLGKTGLNRFLLGSVAQNVVRHTKQPVLVVR